MINNYFSSILKMNNKLTMKSALREIIKVFHSIKPKVILDSSSFLIIQEISN